MASCRAVRVGKGGVIAMDNGREAVRREIVEALSCSPVLRYIGHAGAYMADLREMLAAATVCEFKRGGVLIDEGSSDDRVFFLAFGEVEIRKAGLPICVLKRLGDVFGEMSAITGDARSATVIAKTNVTCLVTDAHLVDDLSKQGKLLFAHLLFQALARVSNERLSYTSAELVKTQEQLHDSQRQNAALRAANAKLVRENEALKEATAPSRLDWAQRKERDTHS